MAHLKGFGLENFRVFKEHTWFDFAPITLLIGPNSSGKSSLTKGIFLFRDNIDNLKKVDFDNILKFSAQLNTSGELHQLGEFENIISKSSKQKVLRFTIVRDSWKIKSKNLYYDFCYAQEQNSNTAELQSLTIKNEKNETYLSWTKNPNEPVKFRFNVPLFINSLLTPKEIDEIIKQLKTDEIYKIENPFHPKAIEAYEKNEEIFHYEELKENTFKVAKEPLDIITFPPEHIYKNKSKEEVDNHLSKEYQEYRNPYPVSINTFNKVSKSKDDWKLYKYFWEILGFKLINNEWDLNDLNELYLTFNDFFSLINIDYLSSVREANERFYSKKDVHIFNTLIKDIRRNGSKYNFTKFIEKWSKIFNIENYKKEFNTTLDGSFITINDKSIVDTGYGISQLVMLFLKLEVKNQGNTLVLEEPEANLHPAFQSKLADMFHDASKTFNQQFIIETHSEYMVRKFQYLVAKGEMKKEDIVIYYFHNPNNVPEGEKQVKKIEILEDGSLSDDFGTGFFDEATNWKFELLKLKKSQRN